MQLAMSVFLSKTLEDSVDPLEYRFLAICSIAYRTWASIRLAHVQGWIKTWATADVCGATKGIGSDHAAWVLSAEIERAQAQQEHT
eukprot:11952522-Alexandrium_andersonii.AAC.1